jgi:hypothetical protein
MAQTDYKSSPVAGINFYAVDSTQKYPLNMVVAGFSATLGYGEFIYLKGVASTVEGSCVTYDEAGISTLLVANAIGPVAWALSVNEAATTYGWYQTKGKIAAQAAASSGDNAKVGYESAAGKVGDGRAAGDEIYGVIARSATDTPATGFIWVQSYGAPFVDDANGA